ncbi:CpaE family protein [Pokkaliibacter sp. CJK22405]|uniref:AAA family ATPase n=1 Tax=Pokkaliibacter sp. CJK22405 TaxID=3384615 RepID=UPI00398569A8
MKILAYCTDPVWHEEVTRHLASEHKITWLQDIEQVEASYEWAQSRVLVIVATQWPDSRIESLLESYVPRPVVVLDQTPEGSWHNRALNPAVHLVDIAEMDDKLSFLTNIRPAYPPKVLGLFSSRNDVDAALLSIAAGWILKRQQCRVVILDLAMPQGDVSSYLDLPLMNSFTELVMGGLNPEQIRHDRRGQSALDNLDLIAMPADGNLGHMTADGVRKGIESLKSHYDHLIINVNGMGPSGLMKLLASQCDQHWILADQKNVSITAALELGEHLLSGGIRPGAVSLVISPFFKDVLPNRETIVQISSLPLRGTLPWSPLFITSLNAGRLMPPDNEFAAYLNALEEMLGLRRQERWWQKLGVKT